jgi:dTDP-4-dehydrorhamnose reductase
MRRAGQEKLEIRLFSFSCLHACHLRYSQRMKLNILGARGMLGTDLVDAATRAGHAVHGSDLPEMDITAGNSAFAALPSCDWVINCAAYTNVDGAESDRDAAFAINATAPGQLAAWCASRQVRLLHISTDYVFDGTSREPYRETDSVHPVSVYGESKLAGEQAIEEANGEHLIVRTQSLFGAHGKHFVKAILDRGRETGQLQVVNDQTSCPTYTPHLAEAILHLLAGGRTGIVHVASSTACTWFDFAVEICRQAAPAVRIKPVTADQFPRPARRPPYSVLDTSRYREWTGQQMPTWQQGLEAFLAGE